MNYSKQRVSPCHVRLVFPDPNHADDFMACRQEMDDCYWTQRSEDGGNTWHDRTGFPATGEGLKQAVSSAEWERNERGFLTRVVVKTLTVIG